MTKKIITLYGIFSFLIYFLILGLLNYHYYQLEGSKYQILSDQVSLSIKTHLMAKDEIGIRIALNKILELDQLSAVKVKTKDMRLIAAPHENINGHKANFLSMLTADTLQFNRSYRLYPTGEESYDISFFYKNTSRSNILLSSLLITLIFLLTSIVLLKSSGNFIFKIETASKIFHVMRSDLLQINAIIKNAPIKKDERIMVKGLIQTILGTAAQFIKGGEKNYNSINHQEVFALTPFIQDIIRGKKIEYQNKVEMILNKSSNISIKSISSELRLAISNIVNNSFDALNGQGKITFDLSCENHLAVLTISDNGQGISSDRLPKIIKGKSYKKDGNGLGIPQTIKIIESLGGEITFRSNHGMETTIYLLSEKFNQYTQEQILDFQYILVEDSKINRVNFEKEASMHGIKVGTFSGYKELQQCLSQFKFNEKSIIYTDSDLGEKLSGEESAKELFYQKGFKDIRLLTARTTDYLKYKKMPWISKIIGKHEEYNFFTA